MIKITLSKDSINHKIAFFETPSGTFDRVDHHGDAVTWQHFITLAELGYTIYAAAQMGYKIDEVKTNHALQTK